jgi:hypothetical protein
MCILIDIRGDCSRLAQQHRQTLVSPSGWAAVPDIRRAPHDGQKPRRLQENATSLS